MSVRIEPDLEIALATWETPEAEAPTVPRQSVQLQPLHVDELVWRGGEEDGITIVSIWGQDSDVLAASELDVYNNWQSDDDESDGESETLISVTETSDESCSICLDPLTAGSAICIRQCHHIFHETCLKPWMQGKRHKTCPACRCQIH